MPEHNKTGGAAGGTSNGTNAMYVPPYTGNGVCPTCGHCSHCGRGGHGGGLLRPPFVPYCGGGGNTVTVPAMGSAGISVTNTDHAALTTGSVTPTGNAKDLGAGGFDTGFGSIEPKDGL